MTEAERCPKCGMDPKSWKDPRGIMYECGSWQPHDGEFDQYLDCRIAELTAERDRLMGEMSACPLVHTHCCACGIAIGQDGTCGCADNLHPIGRLTRDEISRLTAENKMLTEACEAAIRYDQSIAGQAIRGDVNLRDDVATTNSANLDALYDDWMTKVYRALGKVPAHEMPP